MQIQVNVNTVNAIARNHLNENEYNVHTIEFIFSEEYTDDLVKVALFTEDNETYKVIILNNECSIPAEILAKKGTFTLGVYAYEVEDEELKLRYSPSPVKLFISTGSYIKDEDTQNSESITPTDKEQIEQMLNNISLSVDKEGRIVTITFTNKDGTTQTETLEDGKSIEYNWQGTSLGIRQEGESSYTYVDLKGEKGDAGAIKMIIVAELPETGADDTIYLVPITPDVTGNNYAEYVYINGAWELLGKIGVQVDLTDYVKNTDYATVSKAGVIKSGYGANVNSSGNIYGDVRTYDNYLNVNANLFISKGTLENVITGKGLVSDTDYATTSKAGIIRAGYGLLAPTVNGEAYADTFTYATYQNKGNGNFIGKGTLENVITGKELVNKTYVDNIVGDIESILETLDVGGGVQ